MTTFATPTTRPRDYTWRDWRHANRGMSWLHVHHYTGRARLGGLLVEFWRYAKSRIWQRYHVLVVRTLPPTWRDADTRMLHAMFHILGQVIFNERIFETNGCDDDEDATDGKSWAWALTEMDTLWRWWTVDRPAREAEYARRLYVWSELHNRDQAAHRDAHPAEYEPRSYDGEIIWPMPAPDRQPDTEAAWTSLRELDDNVRDDEDDAMLVRLVKVRRYLWT